MRVALVAPEIPDYSLEIAQIVAESSEVLLCIADKHFTKGRAFSNSRLEVAWLRWPRQRQLKNINFVKHLSRLIKGWKPDIVHVMSESNIWLNMLVPMVRPIPVITTIHDVQFHPGDHSSRRVPKIFANTLARWSRAIIVHGSGLRDQAIQELSIDAHSVYIAPHPPLRHYFEVARKNKFSKPRDNVFRVLFYGRIYEYKGLRYLLDAAPLVRAEVPNLRVVIAGTGDDFSKYRDHIKDPSYIEVHNRFISDLDTARLFAEADLLALPYIEASQSGVLMMSIPFGLPVVATEVGEMSNQVRSIKNGLVVPPADKLSLAAAIIQLAVDTNFRKQCSENARAAMTGQYSLQQLSLRMLSIYQQVISRI